MNERKQLAAAPRQLDLFGDGNGTYGPAAQPEPISRRNPIPFNVAFREVSQFVQDELKAQGIHWPADVQKNVVCTVLIAESRRGTVSTWERGK
jgi:hypothetical protein